jgi:hypothetical protein
MAFNGYLIKFTSSGQEFPIKYIQSYTTTPNQRSDADDLTDATGELHINVLPHTSTKIEFNTPPLHTADYEELMSLLRSHYIDELQRDVNIEYYNMETCNYEYAHCYVPDFSPAINIIHREKKDFLTSTIRFAFIEF